MVWRSARVALACIVCTLLVSGLYVAYRAQVEERAPESLAESVVRAITPDDHTLGKRDAPIQMIVYTDLECPYCKRFHQKTLPLLRDEFGEELVVVYRHHPLSSRAHAMPEAQAAECAYEIGGHDAFWSFVDRLFDVTPSNNGFDLSLLPALAQETGLDRSTFEACMRSGRTAARVLSDQEDARIAGATLTPSILIRRGDDSYMVVGDYPARIRTAIEYMRAKEF